MKRLLEGSLLLVLGMVLGRMFDGVTAAATAGAGTGGGVITCASQNGDLNADQSVNISDALTLLNHLFVGTPAELAPLCTPPFTFPPLGHTDGRFVDNDDGTITDSATGLMWQKDSAPGEYTWEEGGKYCEDLELAGHTEWRLPNVRELESLINYDEADLMIDAPFDTTGDYDYQYWTATPLPLDFFNYAFAVNFESVGHEDRIYRKQKDSTGIHVRAVRNAQ